MTTLYVLIGAPGSGKTTWARQNAARLNARVIGSDDVRLDFRAHGRNPLDNDAVFAEVERRAREQLTVGQSVILDATHSQRKYRAYAIELARDLGARRAAIWFDVPLEVCLQRNRHRPGQTFGDEAIPDRVVRAIFEKLESLSPDEFDEVIRIESQSGIS